LPVPAGKCNVCVARDSGRAIDQAVTSDDKEKTMRFATISIVVLALVISAGCEQAGLGSKKPEKRPFKVDNDGPVVMDQGGTGSLTVTITRNEGFTDPVTMCMGNLPSGVTLTSGEKEVTADEVTFEFKADEKAKPISGSQACVSIRPKEGRSWGSWFGITINAPAEEEEAAEGEEAPAEEEEGA
jgi:hypothetical protein